MTLVLKVFGVPETMASFRDLPLRLRTRHMRIALNAAGGVLRDAAVANIPKQSGLLRKSMKVKVKIPDESFNVAHHGRPAYALVGASRNVAGIGTYRKSGQKGRVKSVKLDRVGERDVFRPGPNAAHSGIPVATNLLRPSRYAHLVERGTKGHSISAKSARVLSSGSVVFGRSVRHPGTKARPFLSTAVRTSGSAAQAKALRKLTDGVYDFVNRRRAKVLQLT